MMKRVFIKLSVWVVILGFIQMLGCKGCMEQERIGLLKIKSFLLSSSEKKYAIKILNSWVDNRMSNCCVWEGVKCNATTNRVMDLSLDGRQINYDNSFDGFPVLDFSLFLPFQQLHSLVIFYMHFHGWINEDKVYDSPRSLKQLKILNLRRNYFNDTIIPYLNTLTSLKTLILRDNKIEGFKLKQGLTNLKILEVLDLAGNRINIGSVTRLGLRSLRNLKRLDLGYNGMTINGSLISKGLANMTNLEALDISGNKINGSLTGLGFAKFGKVKALGLSTLNLNSSLEIQGICEWKYIVELDLSGNNFIGHLPRCFSNLTQIKVLDLSYNQLSGNLPSVIANLPSLEYLDLSHNNFNGLFSFSSIANHSKLQVFQLSCSTKLQVENENFPWLPKFQLKVLYLPNCSLHSIPGFLVYQYDLRLVDLSHNKLVGTVSPLLLQNNRKLEHLSLTNNSLSGIFPMPNFKHDLLRLDISKNKFNGQLPGNMGEILPKLVRMRMSENNFEGSIPSSMGEMKRLQLLDLSTNNFWGELPRQFATGCLSLSTLKLSYNKFQGRIFPQYVNFPKLERLYLNNNNFSGKIEEGLLTATSLVALDLSNNEFSGQIPHWIGNFLNLEYLLLANNFLEGNIPVQLGNLEFLKILDISENSLSGSIASSFNLSSLEHLYMHKNAFSGSIPDAFRRSSRLITLDLRGNQFSGTIPHWINEYSGMRILLLRGNYLLGHIPDQLCQLKELSIVDLSYNKFNGSIPECFTNMTTWILGLNDGLSVFNEGSSSSTYENYYESPLLLIVWAVIDNQPSGQREVELMTKNRYESYKGSILNHMTGLDLSCNELTGDIPSEIGNFQKIRALNFSYNFLSGSIPVSFSNLKFIESLDLSHNKLNGQIPSQLTALNFLSNFNVSYNNLSGPTPNTGQFANFDVKNYGGNPDLCGPTINKSCTGVADSPTTPSTVAEENEYAVDMVAFYWSFAASFVTVVLALFSVFWINSYWRRIWFYFVDKFIDFCLYWLWKYVLQS